MRALINLAMFYFLHSYFDTKYANDCTIEEAQPQRESPKLLGVHEIDAMVTVVVYEVKVEREVVVIQQTRNFGTLDIPSSTLTSSSSSSLSSSLKEKKHKLSFGQNTRFTLSLWGQSHLWSHSRRYRQGTSFSSFSRTRLLLWWSTYSRWFECSASKWSWLLTHKRAFCSDLTQLLHLQVQKQNSRSKQEGET